MRINIRILKLLLIQRERYRSITSELYKTSQGFGEKFGRDPGSHATDISRQKAPHLVSRRRPLEAVSCV